MQVSFKPRLHESVIFYLHRRRDISKSTTRAENRTVAVTAEKIAKKSCEKLNELTEFFVTKSRTLSLVYSQSVTFFFARATRLKLIQPIRCNNQIKVSCCFSFNGGLYRQHLSLVQAQPRVGDFKKSHRLCKPKESLVQAWLYSEVYIPTNLQGSCLLYGHGVLLTSRYASKHHFEPRRRVKDKAG